MSISIIIPVLNEAAGIGKLLEMLTNASRQYILEIIVVDGGSTDQTKAMVGQYKDAICLDCPTQSRAAQMNFGAKQAKGEVLYFVHADTFPPDKFWEHIANAMEKGIELGCFRYRFRSKSLMLRINAWFTRFRWLWCQGGDKTLFLKRTDFERLKGYDEYYTIMEEYDFLQRAMPQLRFAVLPYAASVSARKYEQNTWLRVQLSNFLIFSMFEKGAKPELMKQTYSKCIKTGIYE